jgi:phosphoglycolate phosphatase
VKIQNQVQYDEMKYNPILFDIDGTLLDPQLGITSGVQYALSKFGIQEDREMLTPFIGPPINESFQKYYALDEQKTAKAVKYFREYYEPKGLYESTVFRGIPELLTKLHNLKRKLYVVTLKPGYIAEKILQYHDLLDFFDGVKGPKPDLTDSNKTLLMKQTLSLIPNDKNHNPVMIGDTSYDIIAAHENGIDSIGVTFGFGSHEEIKEAHPTYKAKSIKELDKYLL